MSGILTAIVVIGLVFGLGMNLPKETKGFQYHEWTTPYETGETPPVGVILPAGMTNF
jgi:hypothetical protein